MTNLPVSLPTPLPSKYGPRTSRFYPNKFTLILFSLFAVNTVIPLIDLPLIGLSITSVFFGLVALEVVFKSNYLSETLRARWLFPIVGIGISVFLSIAMNVIDGSLELSVSHLLRIVQSLYWLTVFVITMALVSHLTASDVKSLFALVGISIVALGGLRLFEAVVLGRVGPNTSRVLSQNGYGVLFSAFTPFALNLLFLSSSRRMSLVAAIGLLILLVTVGINASRSSWIAVSVGLFVVTLVVVISQPRYRSLVFSLVAFVVAGVILLQAVTPHEVLTPFARRFETLAQIEEDKSYATRILMQQKAWTLFAQRPIFGVGRGEFRNNEVTFNFAGLPFSPDSRTNFNHFASHNSYAALLAETGVVGMLPYVALVFTLIFSGIRSALSLGRRGSVWPVACIAGVVALSIHLWSIDNLQTTSTWFLYGIAAGVIVNQRLKPEAEPAS